MAHAAQEGTLNDDFWKEMAKLDSDLRFLQCAGGGVLSGLHVSQHQLISHGDTAQIPTKWQYSNSGMLYQH